MRIGIQPFELSVLGSIVSEDGSYDPSQFSYPSIVKRCIQQGYKVIEIGLDMGYILPSSLNKDALGKLLEIKEASEIAYTVHLPMWSIEPASPNELMRKASVRVLSSAVKLCEPLDPEVYVIHATGALAAEFSRLEVPQFYGEFICNHMSRVAEESIKELLSETGLESRKLAVENVEFPYRYMMRIVNQNDLSICLDTGHLLAGYSGDYGLMEFLQNNYDRVTEIHLHDGYREQRGDGVRIVRDHLPLGKGKLPVGELFGFLQSNKYSHPIIFELPLAEAKQALRAIEEHYTVK